MPENEFSPLRCQICTHWEQLPENNGYIDEWKNRGHCDGLRDFLSSGADWMVDETSIVTPPNFYCANFRPKNPMISKEDYNKIIGGKIKHDDDD